MGTGWDVQYTNWAEPTALVHLLEGVFRKKYLSATSNNFLLKIMTESVNSPKRIKGLLPDGTVVAHKTGTSNTNEKGMTAATNDVGIITLPNGKHIAMAVFVSNTMEKPETNERIIAEIAKATYDHFNEKK
jgi:beta-lactamase class A